MQCLHIWGVIKADLHARSLSCIDRVTVNTDIQVSKDGQRIRCKHCSLFRCRNEVLALTGPVSYERKLQVASLDTPEHIVRSQSRRHNEGFCTELTGAG